MNRNLLALLITIIVCCTAAIFFVSPKLAGAICLLEIVGLTLYIIKTLDKPNEKENVSKERKSENERKEIEEVFSEKINEIYEIETKGLPVVQSNFDIPNEKIFYVEHYNWEYAFSAGRMKIPYSGTVLITDKKIRFIGDSSFAINSKKIISFVEENATLEITPETGRVLRISPVKIKDFYKSAELGKFYAILQFSNGKKLKDFAKKMCEIMHLNNLVINGVDYLK